MKIPNNIGLMLLLGKTLFIFLNLRTIIDNKVIYSEMNYVFSCASSSSGNSGRGYFISALYG